MYAIVLVLAVSLISGALGWRAHGYRVDQLQERVRILGEEAKVKEEAYKDAKEAADKEYSDSITGLHATADSLRRERDRARSAALSAAAKSSNRVCYDPGKFDEALARFDDGLSRLAAESDNRDARLKAIKKALTE